MTHGEFEAALRAATPGHSIDEVKIVDTRYGWSITVRYDEFQISGRVGQNLSAFVGDMANEINDPRHANIPTG